jgi:hypothetical protein
MESVVTNSTSVAGAELIGLNRDVSFDSTVVSSGSVNSFGVDGGGDGGAAPLTKKLWDQLDGLSLSLSEIYNTDFSKRLDVVTPSSSGDHLVDMQAMMASSQQFQARLMEMQLTVNRAGGVFNVALGMIQSSQNGLRTLFQDK